ncbi:hypothetical protein A3B21_02100 [Candidatus Uhrbacteria bacterium RIFCSPLOWO2_01_FULL_47_24]|uniref:Uncharacterized protein n=1 Tax=Candidatus Uhrbacteria bacterium RIFCSPLOWO2_01_FULL_47_24 TaxID=1802401 RepID=A0A1F7UR45_9BACT|nr:MAG: hypothetical protein A2753_01850 [Candidatus Uhrbacteria bacterium RIFCSPHIGHO2_01_FULL_47_11]OGL67961.1 MAG: hypothetical protein A3D58_05295 [Candidatus Uhrbacteria bacterium RIFCSPHIGHO2_02_FULL_46_47]OGL76450.1 MAG: hypothetical protein A3F52_02935 [Candidatus Uhrbacteria bacterium RIFCSPHIGHO2_12_FULL_47_11]OGL80147.1 MAG: hypothetical protein A3B21_02100 [Candidatus Uhrbacteria bacterium RIFCSPLOWO2_01_FULL_47_24]OGL84931.1 MAG: hypothetical protein A3J03_04480 [Candidatus Uhrbact
MLRVEALHEHSEYITIPKRPAVSPDAGQFFYFYFAKYSYPKKRRPSLFWMRGVYGILYNLSKNFAKQKDRVRSGTRSSFYGHTSAPQEME